MDRSVLRTLWLILFQNFYWTPSLSLLWSRVEGNPNSCSFTSVWQITLWEMDAFQFENFSDLVNTSMLENFTFADLLEHLESQNEDIMEDLSNNKRWKSVKRTVDIWHIFSDCHCSTRHFLSACIVSSLSLELLATLLYL